jgi:hypothetical protein
VETNKVRHSRLRRVAWVVMLPLIIVLQTPAAAGFFPSSKFEAFEGAWTVAKPAGESCYTLAMSINAARDGKHRMSETRRCSDKLYLLNYTVRAFCASGRRLLVAAPTKEGSSFPPAKLVGEGLVTYSPDTLSLWLSVDGCRLTGTRSDRSGIWEFSASRPCPRPAPGACHAQD